VLLVALAAAVAAIVRAGDLLILAFGSMLGAIVIHAVAEGLREHARLPARAALGLSIGLVLAALALLWYLFGVQFRPQVELLITRLPALLAQLNGWLSRSPVGAKVASAVQAAYAGSRVANDIGGLVGGAGELVLNALLLLVGALFFAADPPVYERGFLLLVPRAYRPAFEDALFDVAATLRLWLRAQLIQMTTMGVMIGLGLWWSGVPSSGALGLLAGLSEFVPYVGPIAVLFPALGLAATAGTHPIGLTFLTFLAARMIQSNAITPFVTSRVVSIPPAVTLFAIIGIGYVFGVFGLFFSAALLVVIFTLVRSLYLREVLGEPIPRAPHQRLFRPDPRPAGARDTPT
ncbi:AI-2E family transporter, partial [Sphingomonas bacterium]|uniref:AI-2E family transporter n=1 Tax=Sphingomonas bacterium TaxID=1895847 RepID=UPI0020C66396